MPGDVGPKKSGPDDLVPNDAKSRENEDGATLDYGLLNDLTGHLLRHAFLRGQQVFAEVFADDDVTPLQFMAVELFSKNPGITHRQASKALSTAPSVMTTCLRPMIERGFVIKAAVSGDGRKVGYRLTNEGANWFSGIREQIWRSEDKLLGPLDSESRADLHRSLLRLIGRDVD